MGGVRSIISIAPSKGTHESPKNTIIRKTDKGGFRIETTRGEVIVHRVIHLIVNNYGWINSILGGVGIRRVYLFPHCPYNLTLDHMGITRSSYVTMLVIARVYRHFYSFRERFYSISSNGCGFSRNSKNLESLRICIPRYLSNLLVDDRFVQNQLLYQLLSRWRAISLTNLSTGGGRGDINKIPRVTCLIH